MSPEVCLEALPAQEVLCLTRHRFGITHRALWHLAHLRCGISASTDKSREGSENEPVQILHVEPEKNLMRLHRTRNTPTVSAPALENTHRCWEAQITTKTQVFFVSTRYHFVFSLDMTPSSSVVDTSFKGMSTGSYLFDSLQPCLEDTLRVLLADMHIAGEVLEPEIYVTVIAQAACFDMQVLARAVLLTSDSLADLLMLVHKRLLTLGEISAAWLQGDEGSQPRMSASKHGAAEEHMGKKEKCEDMSFMLLRNCLLALQLTEVSNATPAIIVLTDGVMCNLFRTLSFKNSLMHLNALDVALHIVQIGGGFAPWSSLGMCSDLDLLHFLVSSTPGGVLFQDHHISCMLRQQASSGPTTMNPVQRAWLWRVSSLSEKQEHRARLYSDRSFLSSVVGPDQENDEQSYTDHLKKLGCKVMPQIVLEGLDEVVSPALMPMTSAFSGVSSISMMRLSTESFASIRSFSNASRPHGNSPSASPVASSYNDLTMLSDVDLGLSWEQCGYAAPDTKSLYSYEDMSYSLYGVSLVQVIECRVREGFRLIDQRRFEDYLEFQFSLNWRPMFQVHYNVTVYRTQELRIRIKSHVPSPEYVKHRGPRYQDGDLGEHQDQLDTFVKAISMIDNTLATFAEASKTWSDEQLERGKFLSEWLRPCVLHHWFSVQRFEYVVGDQGASEIHRRLQEWSSATLIKQQRYWRALSWAEPADESHANGLDLPPEFWCRCCAPKAVPLLRISNRAMLPSNKMDALAPFHDAVSPCCMIEILEIDERLLSVTMATLGLCPDAEAALLSAVQTQLIGVGTQSVLGFPGLSGSGSHGALVGRPGILSSLVEVHNTSAPKKSSKSRPHAFQRVSVRGQLGGFSPTAAGNAECIDCEAMDALGPVGGSFFTCVPDPRRLVECLPHWPAHWSVLSGSAAEGAFKVLQNLRIQEGWHCVRKTGTMCCYVKQIPMHSSSCATRRTAGSDELVSVPVTAEEILPHLASQFEAPASTDGQLIAEIAPERSNELCLTAVDASEDGPLKFRLEINKDPDAKIEDTANTISDAPEEEQVEVESSDAKPWEASLFQTGGSDTRRAHAAPFKPSGDSHGIFGTCYYSVHIDLPKQATKRENKLYKGARPQGSTVRTSLCLDTPPGTFDLSLFNARSCNSHSAARAEECTGVSLPAGRPVRVQGWTQKLGVMAVSAIVAPLHPQWPTPVELRFIGADGRVVLRLQCPDLEKVEQRSGEGALDIAELEAYSPSGPAVLQEVWVERVSGFASGTGEVSPLAVEDLGVQLAEELRTRDSLAVRASNFFDLQPLPCPCPAPVNSCMYEELCGLVHSVEARNRLCLEHAFVSADQHDLFLERVGRLVQHRIIYDGEIDSKRSRSVQQGHYFFLIHPRRRTPPIASVGDEWKAESKFQFSMLFIPVEAKNNGGRLHFYVGDGNVEKMHPPPAENSCVAAALSQSGCVGDSWEVAEREDLSQLSRRSYELIERVKEEHGRVRADAVFNQLLAGCRSLTRAEILSALSACSKATTTFPLSDLVAASRGPDGVLAEAVSVWELLDCSVMKTLAAHGFELASYVADAVSSRRSWLFYQTRAGAQPEEQDTKEQFVRFVQIEVSGASSTEQEESTVPIRYRSFSCDLDHYLGPAGEGVSSELESTPNLFQDAFTNGCADEARLIAYYLPTGTTWEEDGRSAWAVQHVPIGKCYGSHRLRWEGMTKLQAWHPQVAEHIVRLGEDVGAAIGIAHADLLRLVHFTSVSTVQTVNRLLERLSDWTIADAKQLPHQLPFQTQFVHSQKISLPIARPDKMRDAQKEVVSELLAASRAAETPMLADPAETPEAEAPPPAIIQRTPQNAQLRRLCKVDDVLLHKTVLLWLSPDEASLTSDSPSFWAFLVLPEEPLIEWGEQSILPVQLLILFTPTFCRSCLQSSAAPPAPHLFFSKMQAALRHATIKTNQILLLEEMFVARSLSELLLPESTSGEDASCEVALTPLEFVEKLRRLPDERPSADEDRKPSEDKTTRSSSFQEDSVALTLHRGRRSVARSSFTFLKDQDDEPEVGTEQNMKFLQLLKGPDALHTTDDLHCHLRGTARVSIAPCLHRYSILSWLGGGSAEGVKSTSTKVSFQQLNEVVSIFEKNRLQTRASKGVWLLFIAGSGREHEKERKGLPYFARPSYERESDCTMRLKLQFFGLAALEAKIVAQLEEKLAAQLEKLAISKLQLHTLDRRQTSVLRSDILAFLRPPGSEPGRSLLLGIPEMCCTLPYAQFVRRALLGLLDPLSEAPKDVVLRSDVSGDVTRDISGLPPRELTRDSSGLPPRELTRDSSGIPPREGTISSTTLDSSASVASFVKRLGMHTSMSFLYTRRLTEAKRSDQRGPQRRDKVSEKVLQFQGRIGDGVALVELNFISHTTGETLEEFAEDPGDLKTNDEHRNILHQEVREVGIVRHEGRFRKLEVESAETEQPVSGYLLLDVWHRSLDQEHVQEFKEELRTTVDQALREYNLQLMLRQSMRSIAENKSNMKQSLKELQQGSLAVLEDMPNQHLSSLLAHNPPDIKFGPQEDHAVLPPCAYMKCVEGLYELLSPLSWDAGQLVSKDLAATVGRSRRVVTLQCASLNLQSDAPDVESSASRRPSDADAEAPPAQMPELTRSRCNSLHEDYFEWFNLESHMGSLQLKQLFDGPDSSDEESERPVTAASLFEQARRCGQDWSPRFVFMWGPPMRAWEQALSGVSEGSVASSGSDIGSEFGFVCEIIGHGLGLPARLDQHKVLPGGAAGLQKQKHTLEEWKQSDKFLTDMELASPFLIVTIDGLRARIRGVHIDPMLLLRVQYFLHSQFMWIWARTQMLLHMCSCELHTAHGIMLHDKLKREFPWIFERHAPGQQRHISYHRDDDSAVEKSSAISKNSIDRGSIDAQSYLIFGVPKLVAEALLKNEIVPSAGSGHEDYLPLTEPLVDSTQTAHQPGLGRTSTDGSSRFQTRSVSMCSETGSSSTVPTMPPLMGGAQPRGYEGFGHRDSSPKSSGSASATGPSRMSPAATASKRGSLGRDKPQLHGVSLQGEVLDGHLGSIRSLEAMHVQADVSDVLVGENLVTNAIRDAFEHEGGCQTVLVDPVTRLAEHWLDQVDRVMEQHRLKLQIDMVVDAWEQNNVPLAGWAREALAKHSALRDSGSHLLDLAVKLRERTTEQSRAALQEPEVFEAETLMLSLIHEHSSNVLDKPFVEPLVVGLGQEAPTSTIPKPSGPGMIRNSAAGDSSRDQRADGSTWNWNSRTVNLSAKLCEAAPVLTVLQRFLSSLLAAFTRPSPAGLDLNSALVTGWTLVLCMEHPLPWHTWDIIGEGHFNGVLMRPQTLLLHRKLVHAEGETALLAEISCRANKLVQIEIFGQHGRSDLACKAAQEVIAAVSDFCFDFRLRSAIDSYDSYWPASHGYVWKRIDDLLHSDVRSLVPHPDRARNLFVNGEVPCRKLSVWLQENSPAKSPGLSGSPLGLRAQHLVGFMHAMANRYGFDCAGEAHKPLLALSALDQHFVRVVRAHAAQADFCSSVAMPCLFAPDAAPTAQGLRCVLFACPVYADASRTVNEGITGELGFKYVAILVDFAWCMSTCMSEGSAGIQMQWKRLAETLRTSAEEALVAFAELLIAKLVSMRRFQALWRGPQRAKVTELQEALAACCTQLDLSLLPMTADSVLALRSLPAMSRTKLGSYLRSAFPGRFCDISGTIHIASRSSGSSFDGDSQDELPARHLFICTSVGNSQSVPNVEERHYVLLHLIWSAENDVLETVWVHSSHRVPAIGTGAYREIAGRSAARNSFEGRGLTSYQDELADVQMTALPEPVSTATVESKVAGTPEVCEVSLMVRRFLVLLVEFALKGHMIMQDSLI